MHFELPLGSQPDKFDGAFDGKDVSGDYSGRFYKEEARSAIFRLGRKKREPLRYKQEEVTFQNGDTKLAGTLFVPWTQPENSKFDWERPAPGWLKTMTDWLAKRVKVST